MALIKHNKGETYEKGMALTWPKYYSVKLDGIRVSGQAGSLITNSGKEIPNRALIEKFAPLVQGLDGELICGPANDPLVYNKTNSAVMSKKSQSTSDIKFYVFDCLDLSQTFDERLATLKSLELPPDTILLEQKLVYSEAELISEYEKSVSFGFEGGILRNPSALYKQGRSTLSSQDLLKLKPYADAEFTVGEMYEAQHNGNEATLDAHGHTVRSSHAENRTGNGMLGGFASTWNGHAFTIAPGSLTHIERRDIWEQPEAYKGRVGVFRYMSHGVLDVPRHPRFKGWRDVSDLTA